MRQVRVDGKTYSFPDDATDDEISEALDGPVPGSALDEATKAFPRGLARVAIAPIATAGAVADAVRRFSGITEGSPLTALAKDMEIEVNQALPRTDNRLATDVVEGVGQMVGLVGGGIVGSAVKKGFGAATATTLATTAEFADTYSREIERQKQAGEPEDHDLALQKSGAHALFAGMIESKLGAGRVLNRIEKAFRGELKLSGVGNFVFNRLRDAGAGFTEEAAQRAIQDLIVDGSLSPDEIVREGGVGAIIQSLFGIPVDIISGPTAALEATGSTATAEAIKQAEAALPTNEEGETLEAQGAQEVLSQVGPAEPAGPTVPEADFGDMPETAENTGVSSPVPAQPVEAQPAFQIPEAAQPPPNPVEQPSHTISKPAAGKMVETRSVRGKGYTIPSESEAGRDEFVDDQIAQFGDDYVAALREAKAADLPNSYKRVLIGRILSKSTAEISQSTLFSQRWSDLVKTIRDANHFIGQSGAAAGQDLQATKQINRDLEPHAAVLSYFKLIEARFDRVVPAALRTEDAAAKINQIIEDCG